MFSSTNNVPQSQHSKKTEYKPILCPAVSYDRKATMKLFSKHRASLCVDVSPVSHWPFSRIEKIGVSSRTVVPFSAWLKVFWGNATNQVCHPICRGFQLNAPVN